MTFTGPSLNYLAAEVSDTFEAGTDHSVYMKLRNNVGTGEQCKTDVLDSPGNSWSRGYWEEYTNEKGELDPCGGFYPVDGKLQFTLDGYIGVSLDKVELQFGRKKYFWSGNAEYWGGKDNWQSLRN